MSTRLAVIFTIPGPPVPKARARVVNGHAHTPAKTRDYERHTGLCALAAASKVAGWRKDWGGYSLYVHVYRAEQRGDADNYLKSCSDGFNGILYDDDSAVREVHIVLDDDPTRPRVDVRVEMVGEETLVERQARTHRERARVAASRKASIGVARR